ncbi:MAG: four helix bundle protein [Patescibacteria group bacterium]
MKYDLEERTAKFAESVIETVGKIQITPVNKRIIEQLVGSSGSIGANYNEANEGESKKDFYHKMQIAKKEIKETQHWLRLLASAQPELKEIIRELWGEVHQLLLIFSKILSTRKNENRAVENYL